MGLQAQLQGQSLQRRLVQYNRLGAPWYNLLFTLEELQDRGIKAIYARENGLQSQSAE